MTHFVIVKSNWEYNDEGYNNRAGKGSGEPCSVFKNKAKAEKRSLALNIKELKGTDLCAYCYCLSDIVIDEEKLCDILGLHSLDDVGIIPRSLTDEEAQQVLECLNITWYAVVEVADGD